MISAARSPRLSGLDWLPLDRELSWVLGRRRFGIEEPVEAPAVHQVDANQAGEGERAGDAFLPGLGEAEQQKGDQRDGDLEANGVFADAEKAGDFEDLLDPAEEQLDRPAALVKIGDLLGGGIQIVRQDAQHLAGLKLDAHLADRILEGIEPALRQARRQMTNPIGQDRGPGRHRQLLDHRQGGAGSEPGDDAALRLIELGPPGVIVIAQVEDIVGAGSIGIACAAVMSLTRAG
jgi:hypothetical protein